MGIRYLNSGHSCIDAKRMIAARQVYNEFIDIVCLSFDVALPISVWQRSWWTL